MHRVSLRFAVRSDGNDIKKNEINPFLYKHELYTYIRMFPLLNYYSFGECPNIQNTRLI